MQVAVSVFNDFIYKVEDKPLEKILNDIKIGTYKAKISDIRSLMSNDNKTWQFFSPRNDGFQVRRTGFSFTKK